MTSLTTHNVTSIKAVNRYRWTRKDGSVYFSAAFQIRTDGERDIQIQLYGDSLEAVTLQDDAILEEQRGS